MKEQTKPSPAHSYSGFLSVAPLPLIVFNGSAAIFVFIAIYTFLLTVIFVRVYKEAKKSKLVKPDPMKVKITTKYSWLGGLAGLSGLNYFSTGLPVYLFFFGFFALFGFYFVYRYIRHRINDERMVANHRKAWTTALAIPFSFVIFTGVMTGVGGFAIHNFKMFIAISSGAAFALTMITYCVSFYWYEKYSS